jgi:3-dehydroquinate synthetase
LPKDANVDDLIGAMGRDKKAHHSLSFVLGDGVGFEVVHDVREADVRVALERFREECA